MQTTDLHLYAQWRRHRNAAAFNELARRHAAMVFGTCQRILRSAADAEEVAQECFETLATTTQGPDQNLGGWLHALATRRALNRLKSEIRRREREQTFADAHPTTADVHWDDIYPLVDESIAALPDKLREPLIRNFFEGQTHESIATELGVSRGAVTYRIAQGVERIRKHLKQRGVVTGAAALTAMLAESLASAETPAKLTDAIARMALAGPPPVAVAVVGSTSVFSVVTWKSTAALVGAALATGMLAGVWLFFKPKPGGVPLPPLAFDAPVAGVEPPIIEAASLIDSAQDPYTQDVPDLPVFDATLAGRAVDATGHPVAGATVTLKRNFQPMLLSTWKSSDPLAPYRANATTDDLGTFTFAVPNLVNSSSSNNGYHTFSLWASHSNLGAFHQIPSYFVGPGNNHVELTMEPLSQISGIIVDSDGKPVLPRDIQVQKRIGGNAGFQDWKIYAATPSFGEGGVFAIQGLSPGRYFLRVIAEGFPPGEVEAVAGQNDVRVEMPIPLHVRGVVRDEKTGRPVPGVKLVAYRNPEFPQEILSDASGAFTIADLPPGNCILWLSQGNQPYAMDPMSHRLDLSDGQSIESLDITVYQGGTVTGRVVNARTGLTTAGGVVQACIPDRPEYEIGGSLLWRVPVDTEGRYQIEGLPRGSYVFIAEDAGAKPTFQEVYPGRLYENVDVFVEPGISVSGKVLGPDGNGAPKTIVIAVTDSHPYSQQTCTDDDGNFDLWWKEEPMEAKSIRLQAMTANTLSAATPDMPLNPEGIDGVVLRLEAAGVLKVDVRYASGGPAAGAKVVLAPKTLGVDVIGFHKAPNDIQTHYSGGLEATSTASGRVFLGPLPLGSYVVMAHPPGLDESNLVTTQTMQISDESATIQLTLNSTLQTRPAVTGQVTFAGAPLVGAEIGLSPLEPGQKSQWARSDAEGRYRFEEVPQGAAHLRGTYSPTGQSVVNSRVVEIGEIEIADTGDTVVDIGFGTGSATLEGTVMIGGQPLADVSIGVHVRRGESVFTTTDHNGAYAVDAIADGKITVNAKHGKKGEEGHWLRTVEEELAPGERRRIDFSLGASQLLGTVSGIADGDSVIVAVVEGSLGAPTTLEEATVFVESEKIIARAEIDLTGVFEFNNIPQGTYTVVTVAMTLNENGDGLVENGFRAVGAEVVVEDGRVTEVNMALAE